MPNDYKDYMKSPEFLQAQVVALAEAVEESCNEVMRLERKVLDAEFALSHETNNRDYIIAMIKHHVFNILTDYPDDVNVISLDRFLSKV
jgi:hypothetical protein